MKTGTTLMTLGLVILMAGCGAKTVRDLRENPGGTLEAHSGDSLDVTMSRVADGMRKCVTLPIKTVRDSADEPADVMLRTEGPLGGVMVNAHLAPESEGTDASIDYKYPTWRKPAENMQRLVNNQSPDC